MLAGSNGPKSCLGVPTFPEWAVTSEPYQALFDDIARQEFGQDPAQSSFQLDEEKTCRIRQAIEGRRRQVSHAAHTQLQILPSATFSEGRLNKANPAEREWLIRTSDDLQALSMDIFGEQSHPNYKKMKAWMELRLGDEFSALHFWRMRGIKPPVLEVAPNFNFQNPEKYANLFPWLPTAPTFSAMYPFRFSQEELEYINEHYDKNDPPRQNWTVLERVTTEELAQIKERKEYRSEVKAIIIDWQKVGNQPIVWMVKGKENQWYRVTNMAYHERFRPYFLGVAQILKRNANTTVQGTRLNPEFRQFTLLMADRAPKGQFLDILKADLNQTKGNLFLSFFPHEGYWEDGMKFPWMFEVGIREPMSMTKEELEIFQEVEDFAAEVAKANNLPYQRREIKSEEAAKAAVSFWCYRNGGFLRAYFREVGGHDYPKAEYEGLSGEHRNVIILDAMLATIPMSNAFLRDGAVVFEDAELKEIDPEDLIEFVKNHEGGHGTDVRADTPLSPTGRKLSDVYGKFWGLLVEPRADWVAAFVTLRKFEKGLIKGPTAEATLNRKLATIVTQQFRRYFDKKRATDLRFMENPDAAHTIGASSEMGLFSKNGVVRYEDGKFKVRIQRYREIIRENLAKYILSSLKDALPGYQRFVQDSINQNISDEADAKLSALKKAYGPPFIINRNPQGVQ